MRKREEAASRAPRRDILITFNKDLSARHRQILIAFNKDLSVRGAPFTSIVLMKLLRKTNIVFHLRKVEKARTNEKSIHFHCRE